VTGAAASDGWPAAAERALARVDLGAIGANCERLRSTLRGGAQLCAVVKADGYGHGAAASARAARSGGAGWLAVATAREAVALRESGDEGRLLVMGSLTLPEARAAVAARADVVVWSAELLAALPAGARVHVKLDTGMGRLGTKDPRSAVDLCDAAEADERLELAGAMTHFATADEPGDEHLPAQLERFTAFAAQLRDRHPELMLHAANSAATLREPASHLGMVRCGVAIYGLDPFQRDPAEHGLEPALALESWVATVKRFEPGESAGYGRRFVAHEPTWIATLPIGYGDGWRRALSDDCDVLVGGRRYPLVGTVSMDNVTIDLGAETTVRAGDQAILIGAQGDERILCEEVAQRLQTINYEVTCGLGPRLPRAYA
jgi:alanine racemase